MVLDDTSIMEQFYSAIGMLVVIVAVLAMGLGILCAMWMGYMMLFGDMVEHRRKIKKGRKWEDED